MNITIPVITEPHRLPARPGGASSSSLRAQRSDLPHNALKRLLPVGLFMFWVGVTALCWTALSYGEPVWKFGEEGVYLGSPSYDVFHTISAIEGGDRVIMSWSACDIETGLRQINVQIVNREGNLEYESPLIITDPQRFTTSGASATDGSGCYYIAWLSISEEDSSSASLCAQKFDSNGNLLWGERYSEICNLRVELTSHDWETLCPDERGGCYYLSSYGFYAISDEGELRQDWESQEDVIQADEVVARTASDERGGVWIVTNRPWGENVLYQGFNHYSYLGEKLFEEPREHRPAGLPGLGRFWPYQMAGYQGGIVTTFWSDEIGWGLCVLDSLGELIGDDRFHPIGAEPSFHSTTRLPNGKIIFNIYIEDNERQYDVNTLLFDPVSNELEWGENGRSIVEYGAETHVGSFPARLDENENYIMTYSLNPPAGVDSSIWRVYRIDGEGEMIDEPWEIIGPTDKGVLSPGNDGFWFKAQGRGYYLNYASNSGEVASESGIAFPMISKGFGLRYCWQTEGGYRLLSGSKIIELNSRGEVIGDRLGTPFYDSTLKVLSDFRTEELYVLAAYTSTPDNPNRMTLFSFDREGNLNWQQSYDDEILRSNSIIQINRSLDGERLYVSIQSIVSYRGFHSILSININDGSLNWRNSIDETELAEFPGVPKFTYLAPDTSGIVVVYGQDGDYLKVNRYWTDGDLHYTARHRMPEGDEVLCVGATAVGHRGARICFVRKIDNELMAWTMKAFSGRNIGDSLALFEQPISYTNRFWLSSIGYPFTFFKQDEREWFSPNSAVIDEGNPSIPIQAIQADTLVFGPDGFTLNRPANSPERNFRMLLCPNNEFYVSRSIAFDSLLQKRITLLSFDGTIHDGFGEFGIPLNWQVLGVIGDNDLALYRYQDARLNRGKIYFQHLENDPASGIIDNPETSVPLSINKIDAYPNPFNGVVNLHYRSQGKSNVLLNISDVSGRVVFRNLAPIVSAEGSMSIDLSPYSSGLYLINLEQGEMRASAKCLLLK